MGPPSSGAITINQILGIIEEYNISSLGYNNADTWRIIGDASRLAFADRGKYIADNDFIDVPIHKLIDKKYLKLRSQKLETDKMLRKVKAGKLIDQESSFGTDSSPEFSSTTHI